MNHEETDKRFEEQFIFVSKHVNGDEHFTIVGHNKHDESCEWDCNKREKIKAFIHSERELAYKEGQESVLNCDCKEKSDGKEGYFCNLCDSEAVKKMEKAALIKKLEDLKIIGEFEPWTDERYEQDAYNRALSNAIKIIEDNL